MNAQRSALTFRYRTGASQMQKEVIDTRHHATATFTEQQLFR